MPSGKTKQADNLVNSLWSCLSPLPDFTYWCGRWISDSFFFCAPKMLLWGADQLRPVATAFHQVQDTLCAPTGQKTRLSQQGRHMGAGQCSGQMQGARDSFWGSATLLHKWGSWSPGRPRKQHGVLLFRTLPTLPAPLLLGRACSWATALPWALVLTSVISDGDTKGWVVNSLLCPSW